MQPTGDFDSPCARELLYKFISGRDDWSGADELAILIKEADAKACVSQSGGNKVSGTWCILALGLLVFIVWEHRSTWIPSFSSICELIFLSLDLPTD